MISRGSICWVDLGEPRGSRPAKVRPVLVLQDDAYNSSRLATTIAAVITSNTGQAAVAGRRVRTVPFGSPMAEIVPRHPGHTSLYSSS